MSKRSLLLRSASSRAMRSRMSRAVTTMIQLSPERITRRLDSNGSFDPSLQRYSLLMPCVEPVAIISSYAVSSSFRVTGRMSAGVIARNARSEEHTSELQSQSNLVCRLLLEKKKTKHDKHQ